MVTIVKTVVTSLTAVKTPEEFAQYRATGKLPGQGTGEQDLQTAGHGPKQDGILAKLGSQSDSRSS